MKTALIWVAMLSALASGCAHVDEAQNNEPNERNVSLMICATSDGYQFQTSCPPSSKLTAIQAAPTQVKSEPIEPMVRPTQEMKTTPSFTLFFGDNKYEPSQAQRHALKVWIETNRSLLNNHSVVKIEAYTSANGSMSHNKKLAEARALSVQTALKANKVYKVQVSTFAKCCRTGVDESSMSLDRKVFLSIQQESL